MTDPVCGMQIDPDDAAGSEEYQGTTYHFCSRHCVEKFNADPEKYLGARSAPEPHSCCETGNATPPVPGAK